MSYIIWFKFLLDYSSVLFEYAPEIYETIRMRESFHGRIYRSIFRKTGTRIRARGPEAAPRCRSNLRVETGPRDRRSKYWDTGTLSPRSFFGAFFADQKKKKKREDQDGERRELCCLLLNIQSCSIQRSFFSSSLPLFCLISTIFL